MNDASIYRNEIREHTRPACSGPRPRGPAWGVRQSAITGMCERGHALDRFGLARGNRARIRKKVRGIFTEGLAGLIQGKPLRRFCNRNLVVR